MAIPMIMPGFWSRFAPPNGRNILRQTDGWLLLICAVCLLFIRHAPFDLDRHDEAKQAYASYEIAHGGSWFYQHAPFGASATKPPLMAWISVALHRLTGHWQTAWRLPSFLAMLSMGILLFRAGERSAPGLGGWSAVLALMFCQISTRLALMSRTDALLALWILWIALRVRDVAGAARAWRPAERGLLAAGLAAALFTKGPVVYMFSAAGWLALIPMARRKLGLRHAGAGPLPWLISLALFLAWVAGGAWSSALFRQDVLGQEFTSNFSVGMSAGETILRAVFQYPLLVLHRWFPWSLALAFLLWPRRVRRALWRDPGTRSLIVSIVAAFLLMGAIPDKRVDRIYPVIPLLCLLLSEAIRRHAETSAHPMEVRAWMRRWLPRLGLIALVAWGPYTVQRTRREYRRDADAVMRFGHAVAAYLDDAPQTVGIERNLAIATGIVLYTGLSHENVMALDEGLRRLASGRLDAFILRADDGGDPATGTAFRSRIETPPSSRAAQRLRLIVPASPPAR